MSMAEQRKLSALAFIGGPGVNFAEKAMQITNPRVVTDLDMIVAHTHWSHIETRIEKNTDPKVARWVKAENGRCKIEKIGANTTRGEGSGGDLNIGRQAMEENLSGIKQTLIPYRIVATMIGLGGGTGGGGAPLIIDAVIEAKKASLAVLVKPHHIEGKTLQVDEALTMIRGPKIKLSNDKISAKDLQLSVDVALQKPSEGALIPLLWFIPALQKPAYMYVDPRDIESILRPEREDVYFGYTEITRSMDARAIARALLNNPYIDGDIVGRSEEGLILFEADVNYDIILKVVELVKRAMAPRSADGMHKDGGQRVRIGWIRPTHLKKGEASDPGDIVGRVGLLLAAPSVNPILLKADKNHQSQPKDLVLLAPDNVCTKGKFRKLWEKVWGRSQSRAGASSPLAASSEDATKDKRVVLEVGSKPTMIRFTHDGEIIEKEVAMHFVTELERILSMTKTGHLTEAQRKQLKTWWKLLSSHIGLSVDAPPWLQTYLQDNHEEVQHA